MTSGEKGENQIPKKDVVNEGSLEMVVSLSKEGRNRDLSQQEKTFE